MSKLELVSMARYQLTVSLANWGADERIIWSKESCCDLEGNSSLIPHLKYARVNEDDLIEVDHNSLKKTTYFDKFYKYNSIICDK